MLALPFSSDDFFASIRSAYNLRAEDPAYERLTFCLLGVAAPADLISNSVRTPFNIGREIRLEDFSRAELDAFRPGLEGLGGSHVYEYLDRNRWRTLSVREIEERFVVEDAFQSVPA